MEIVYIITPEQLMDSCHGIGNFEAEGLARFLGGYYPIQSEEDARNILIFIKDVWERFCDEDAMGIVLDGMGDYKYCAGRYVMNGGYNLLHDNGYDSDLRVGTTIAEELADAWCKTYGIDNEEEEEE